MFKTREDYLKSELSKKDFFGNKDLTFEEFKQIKTECMFCGECGRRMKIGEKLYLTEARESYHICKECADKKNNNIIQESDAYHYDNDKDLYNSYLRFTNKVEYGK